MHTSEREKEGSSEDVWETNAKDKCNLQIVRQV